VLFDDLFGLRWYSVWETHLELHYQIPTLGWIFWERQAFSTQSLDCAWFDDIVAGQCDRSVVNGGNVHCAATQSLSKRKKQSEVSADKRR